MHFLRTYLRALSVLRGDRRVACVLALANILVAGLQFLDPLLFGRVVGLLAGGDRPADGGVLPGMVTLLAIWAVVGGANIAASIAASLHAERLAHRNRLGVMSRFFAHVLALPLSFHGGAHSGRMLKVMLSGGDSMFGLWLTFFREQLATAVAVLVLLPLTVFLNWRLAIALIVLVVLFAIMTVLVVHNTEAGQRRAQHYQGALAETAQDALSNVVVVQSFTRLAEETRRFGATIEQLIRHQFPVLTGWAVVSVLTRAASTIAVISVVMLGTLLHAQGRASVAEIVSFMGLANLLIARMESAMSFASRLFMEVPSIDEFFAVLDTASVVAERPHARALVPVAGEVVFDDVAFAYPGASATLEGVSFTARPGSAVALVGHTGAGKSTAMSLLQRLWDPSSGSIRIDGQDVRDVSLDSLRRNIGVVFQESMLLNRTIRENLLVGKPDASDDELERACRMADAHEFIARQKDGYDTLIGERGATLSGGQRQRLAIARALLKDPPILILDEATSALDAATEARVGRALRTLMTGRTTFIIAHRLSTVRDADEILVFDGGRVVERGKFDALLSRGGRFAELFASQFARAVEPA